MSLFDQLTGSFLTGGASDIWNLAGDNTDAASILFDPGDLSGIQKRKEAKKLAKIEAKRNRLMMARQGAETIRQAQLQRAILAQQAANSGVSETSAVQGAQGSMTSQMGANLGFANQIFSLNQQAGKRLQRISDINATTKLAMTIGSFFVGGAAGAAVAAGGGGDTVSPQLGGNNINTTFA